jgi:hypothetical protein
MFLRNMLPPFLGEVKARISSGELIRIYHAAWFHIPGDLNLVKCNVKQIKV